MNMAAYLVTLRVCLNSVSPKKAVGEIENELYSENDSEGKYISRVKTKRSVQMADRLWRKIMRKDRDRI
jgi:hypothetical protein